MRDWDGLRHACESGESLAKLSRRLDIPYSTLLNRAVKEEWTLAQESLPCTAESGFERVGHKLLRRIEECLDRDGELDLKELKTVTGALKELQSLWEEKNGTKGGGLTVRFEGEAEEMSL